MDIQSHFLISLWLFATIFASTKGIRFLLLLVPAFALAVGIGVAKTTSIFSRFSSSLFDINKKYIFSLFAILSLLLLLTPTIAVHAQAQSQFPSMNDQWWNALSKIDKEASEDAIITSWWDFGHWFKFIARRTVTFDGGSQDSPPAHWVGKTLLTANEKEAVGILRMLDCGLHLGYDTLYEHTNDDVLTIQMLNDMFVLDREGAKAYLEEKSVPGEVSNSLLEYTHCEPPEAYFITSQDMVNKAGVWAHFGSWDFTRAKIVNIVNNNGKDESISKIESLGIDSTEATALYDEVKSLGINKDANTWIASWPNYYTGSAGCQLAEEKLICSNGILLDTTTGVLEVHIQEGVINPKVYSTINAKGEFTLLENGKPSGNNPNQISASLVPQENGGYLGVLHHEALAGSMFNRLFYFKGKGLDCFNLFEYQKTVTADDIYVWKVDWSCGKE